MNDSQPTAERPKNGSSLVLSIGLTISILLMLAGLTLIVVRGESLPDTARVSFWRLPSLACSGEAAALLRLGLLMLMITPVIRVALLGAAWAGQRAWSLAAAALGVLALLLLSIWLS